MGTAAALVSVFVREPEFQGQTKDKLATPEAAKIVETTLRDHFEHYLTSAPADADKLLGWVIDRAEERVKRRQEKEVSRKSAVRKDIDYLIFFSNVKYFLFLQLLYCNSLFYDISRMFLDCFHQ